jgi:hypothetical protein
MHVERAAWQFESQERSAGALIVSDVLQMTGLVQK